MGTDRKRTAMVRNNLSRPMRLALNDEIISETWTVFDYGCGRGDDVRRLSALGYAIDGWDPHFRPRTPVRPADVVNMGYVINVIENPLERTRSLKDAWANAERVLVVSARLTDEKEPTRLTRFSDGWLTARNTFQKFYEQAELRAYIDSTLAVESVAAAPGVFYVFRDAQLKEGFLASRARRRRVAAPRRRISDELFEIHRELLEPLMAFYTQRGRLPAKEELEETENLTEAFGSIKRAFRVVLNVTDEAEWSDIRQRRKEDLTVYLGLANFGGRPRFTQLPDGIQRDVRSLFGSYKAGTEYADHVLYATGSMERINLAMTISGVGKRTPSALYVHTSALDDLPLLLRMYEGCANRFIGHVEEANIVKLSREEPRVSYLSYPDFDRNPHPALASSVIVPLQTFWVKYRDYSQSSNPPILHRKEDFVANDYPGKMKFARLTQAEEAAGLLAATGSIGTRIQWEEQLRKHGLGLSGHQLARAEE